MSYFDFLAVYFCSCYIKLVFTCLPWKYWADAVSSEKWKDWVDNVSSEMSSSFSSHNLCEDEWMFLQIIWDDILQRVQLLSSVNLYSPKSSFLISVFASILYLFLFLFSDFFFIFLSLCLFAFMFLNSHVSGWPPTSLPPLTFHSRSALPIEVPACPALSPLSIINQLLLVSSSVIWF